MYHDEYIEFQNEMNMKFDTQRMKIERLESKQRVPIGSNFDHLRSQANENDKDPNAFVSMQQEMNIFKPSFEGEESFPNQPIANEQWRC